MKMRVICYGHLRKLMKKFRMIEAKAKVGVKG